MEPSPMDIYRENDDSSSGSKSDKKVLVWKDDVVEIENPPSSLSWKSYKRGFDEKKKKVIHHEVIDVDEYEDSADLLILDVKIDAKNKRKAVKDNSESSNQVKDDLANHLFGASPANVVQVDDLDSDLLFDDGNAHFDPFEEGFTNSDHYSLAQAYYESAMIPPGVEAPIPSWLDLNFNAKQVWSGSGSSKSGNRIHTVGSSSSKHAVVDKKLSDGSFQSPMDPSFCAFGVSPESSDEVFQTDYYAFLQAYLESANIPPGVETSVPPMEDNVVNRKHTGDTNGSENISNQMQTNTGVSWFEKPAHVEKWSSSSGYVIPAVPENHVSQVGKSSSPWLPLISPVSKKLVASQFGGNVSDPPPSQSKKVLGPSSSHISLDDLVKASPPLGIGSDFFDFTPVFHHKSGTSNVLHAEVSAIDHSMSWDIPPLPFSHDNSLSHPNHHKFFNSSPILSEETAVRTPRNMKEDDILRKYQVFKKFDSVEDHADHHYASSMSSANQPPKNWAKRIQDEWIILKNDLPDSIFVRVYETRMDLLRAVIVGAEGTPYHNGLFFFDIFFPDGFPHVPPLVYYHSWGLRINPNLYESGKVCLSLLGTWSGDKNEKWLPGVSTVLQVLVSIQALVLNQKPYFNEPGYESLSNTVNGEKQSQHYSEKAFFLSLKTMAHTVRRPPKHFEEFVFGHFYKHAHEILMSCQAYKDPVQPASAIEGAVQGAKKTKNRRSNSLRHCISPYVGMLLEEFSAIGIKDMERFEELAKPAKSQIGGMSLPKAAI